MMVFQVVKERRDCQGFLGLLESHVASLLVQEVTKETQVLMAREGRRATLDYQVPLGGMDYRGSLETRDFLACVVCLVYQVRKAAKVILAQLAAKDQRDSLVLMVAVV